MELPCQLKNLKIAVIGMGLMGGGLAMALLGKCKHIYGVDKNEEVVTYAKKLGVFSRVSTNLAEIIPLADALILAIPVRAIISLINELDSLHNGSVIVLDLGSTKEEIVRAMDRLPERFDPIGGHPMCGKEKSSLIYADPIFYKNAPFALTPLARTTPAAHSFALEIVHALGAYPVWLDPATHDQWTAATSHLPYLVANALANTTPFETTPLIGPGFRSTARLAVSDIEMIADIFQTNKQNIIQVFNDFLNVSNQIHKYLSMNQMDDLFSFFRNGAEKCQKLIDLEQTGDK